MKTKINITEWADNAVKLISENWMLISSGNKDKFNTMTASWGGIGYLWNKPVVYVFVRPERYTFEFIEKYDTFTLTFYSDEYKKALGILGTRSGRNSDKITESGLTPCFTESENPCFSEARITIECKKLYSTMLTEDAFEDKSLIDKWYTQKGGLHKMYVAEVLNIWENR